MKGFRFLATGIAFILALLALPFIWLYEQVGGTLFVVIVFSVLGATWWLVDRRKRLSGESEPHLAVVFETDAQKKARKMREAEEFHVHNRRIIEQRQQAQREESAKASRVHHVVAPDGEVLVDWHRQFEEITKAWRQGDYDFARNWQQKLAYRLKSEEAPQAIHDKFKALMMAFARDDPLYADVMRVALPAIAEQPDIIQSQLAKQFPQFNAEQFRYAMYYAEVIGDVIRQKKGRSYALALPTS